MRRRRAHHLPGAPRRGRAFALAPLLIAALLVSVTSCSKDREPAEGTITIASGGVDLNAIERRPTAADAELTVLFLHGQAYSSRIWDDRGILDAVAAEGHRAVAVDLPGFGDSPERPSGAGADSITDGMWLRGLIEEMGGPAKVVLVSPSMSGRYSLSYLEEFPAEPLAGFVPVAPVGIDDFERPEDATPIPARSIWGSDDPSYSPSRADRLIEQMRAPADEASTEVIEGASHACYDDHPEEFTALLLAFLAQVSG